jgi:DNA polymerase-4
VKAREPRRSILHVDLDPFFVSVERSLDASLRGRPVVVGGDGSTGFVAAASAEARAAGVQVGQALAAARRSCPGAVFRPGDLEAYARVSDEVTRILLSVSRRVERPSADEAYVDLTPERASAPPPASLAERVRDELQRRLGLDASFGLASTRLAARVASSWARPRGLLLVLPGYERSFIARQPLATLPDLPPHLVSALEQAGLLTLGDVAQADEATLRAAAGSAASALRATALGEGEAPVALAAPPTWILEEAPVRDPNSDLAALLTLLDGLAARAARRLRPHQLGAESVSVEVLRGSRALRRSESIEPGVSDDATLRSVVRRLAGPLLEPPRGVRALGLRLGRLTPCPAQATLFPTAASTG